MIVDRYYYQQLNQEEQAIYRAFYKGVMAHQDMIPVPIRGKVSKETFYRVFAAVTRDNPLIYFLNQSACTIADDIFGHSAICPQYFFSQEKVKEYNRKIEKTVANLAAQLQLTECGEYERELRIHDWICKNISYDFEGSDSSQLVRVISSHNIIGVFAHHKAQCEGIAKAVKVLLNAVDVKCIVATGETKAHGTPAAHAWNIVNIDGEPYQLDVTWDIGAMRTGRKSICHDYFNLTDAVMNLEHKSDRKYPACKSKKANYFVQNQCSFRTRRSLVAYIDKLVELQTNVFEFCAEGRLNKSTIEKETVDYILQKLQEQGKSRVAIRTYANRNLGVYRIEIS